MIPPLDDTIVAVATGWSPAPLGILRFSGPQAFEFVPRLGDFALPSERYAQWTSGRVTVNDGGATLPAEVFWFRGPRSFTGQDMAELHVCGALPLLRILAERAIRCGARSAAPGEFTARAYRLGKLDAGQVAAILAQLGASGAAAARSAARGLLNSTRDRAARAETAITELLALIEAGIDFVDEEDIRFIDAPEIRSRLLTIRGLLGEAPRGREGWGLPHVVLAGRPSAGKSTLFNTLAGTARAIVSPILGTTRDVLMAEVELADGVRVMLVDTPGRLISPSALEAAALQAAEDALEAGDIVVWLHDCACGWTDAEQKEFDRLPHDRRMLVLTKSDLTARDGALDGIRVSAVTDPQCAALRRVLCLKLSESEMSAESIESSSKILTAREALDRATAIDSPELLSLELRLALQAVTSNIDSPVEERVLDQIFSKFCVGK